jgi:hypothetical protein
VAVADPEVLVARHVDVIGEPGVPLVQVLAVLVEYLHAVIRAIGHVDPALGINGDAVHGVEVARTRLLARFAPLPPFEQVLAIGVELDDAGVDVAVADEEVAVRQPRDVRRTAELRLIAGRLPELAQVITSCLPSLVNL